MKKLVLFLLLAAMVLVLVACNPTPADTTATPSTTTSATTADPSINQPAEEGTPLTVLSCQQISYINGERTYRLTFSNGSTADFSVKDGEPGAPGLPGTPAPALTVLSCTAVSTDENGVTTWRITFSDNSTADFTVTNATPMDGNVDWEELLAKIEEMTDMLTVKSPDMENANSTVSDSTKTSYGTYRAPNAPNLYITGWGFPMTKSVMFGDADTVYAMRLNKFKVFDNTGAQVTSGEVTVEVQLRAFDSTHQASKSTLVKLYNVTTTLTSAGYIDLNLTIPKSDLAALGDNEYFLMHLNIVGDGTKAIAPSLNTTFHFVPTDRLTKPDGNPGGFLYTGYVVMGGENKVPSDSYSQITPEILFATSIKSTPIDLSGLLAGGAGNGGDAGEGGVPELNVENLLQLPAQYDLVVGDNFELFYKGITLALDSDDLDYELRYSDGKSRGNAYERKYMWMPTEADVGVHTLTVTVRDNFGRALDVGTVKMNVVNKPKSPSSERTYLFIGDSLSSAGTWPKEAIRRLTSTGTSVTSSITGPKGDGITNIKTIGTLKTGNTASDVFYEGYGGWSAESYTTAYTSRPYFVYINGNFSDLVLHQHSHYKDDNGQIWKLEAISDNRLKLIAVSSVGGNIATGCKGLNIKNGVVPSTGKLTWFDGTQGEAQTITYTSTTPAEGNPFWNAETGKNDFKAYAAKHGAAKIDEAIILLGWNNTTTDPARLETLTRTLVEDILRDYPECHVTLVGLQVPSRDGFAASYGIAWPYYEKLSIMFDICNLYESIAKDAKYGGSVSYVSVAGQFDAEHCYATTNMPVNNRVPTTEAVQNNGVHPNNNGYYQIADAVYRHLVTRLQ